MAQYQINDVVLFLDGTDNLEPVRGTITHIFEDTDEGDDISSYLIQTRETDDDPPIEYEVTDDDITALVSRPPSAIAEPVPQPMGVWEQLQANVVRAQPLDLEEYTRRMAQRWAVDLGVTGVGVDPIQRMDLAGEAIPVERPDPMPIPVVEAVVGRYSPSRHDYAPVRGSTRLYSFTIPGVALVTPVFDRLNNVYKFVDVTGRRWVNRFEYVNVQMFARLRDGYTIHWMLYEDYLTATAERMDVPGLRKKKLRRKYDKMPVIKDESHYAGKEFIA